MDVDVNMSTSSEDEIYLPINSNEDPDYLNNYSTYSEADDNDLANDDDDQLDNNNSETADSPQEVRELPAPSLQGNTRQIRLLRTC